MQYKIFYMSILGITLSLSGCNSVASENNVKDIVNDAKKAFDNDAMQTALELSMKACNMKSSDGCFLAGNIYKSDNDTKNDINALKFFNLAAQYGSTDANYELGKIYYTNNNHKQSISFFEKAAQNNDVRAQLYLAFIYSVHGNYDKSFKWKEKAFANPKFQTLNVTFDEKYAADSDNGAITLQTQAGTLESMYDNENGFTSILLEGVLIENFAESSQILNCRKFKFQNHDLIILVHRPAGMAYQDSPYNYIVYNIQNTLGVVSRMSFTIDANEGNQFISNFDEDNFLLSLGNGKQIFSYQNFDAKFNSNPLPQAGYSFVDSTWKLKFQKLLGKSYFTFLEKCNEEDKSFFHEESNSIIGRIYQSGDGLSNQMIFSITPDGKTIKAITIQDGKVTKHGFTKWDEVPNLFKEFPNFNYKYNEYKLVQ